MESIINDRYRSSTIKTDKNTTYNFRLKVKHRLSAAIKKIPSNAIINKGRCGIGGTYLEIIAERNSIIVVPTNAIIDDKCFVKNKLRPNYFVVRGKFDEYDFVDLKLFMESDKPNKKIFSTPEGLRKIVTCGADMTNIYKDWFLLFDEAHTPISDSYRKRILDAFQFFFEFHNKALISATPFRFSDPRFENMDVYNIMFKGYVNRVEVMKTNHVPTLLYSILLDEKLYPGRVHIFLNSVIEISNVISRSELKDYSIFCKGDRKNVRKLDQLRKSMHSKPCEENYSKFNFYTSKYFEGWDLRDPNATIIVVSDYDAVTLKSGVSNKCVQAAGRNRLYSNQIIHVTNSRDLREFKPVQEIQRVVTRTIENTVMKYNDHLTDSNVLDFAHDAKFEALALEYADINYYTKAAVLNAFKIDQFVNQKYSSQEFNHIDYIVDAWKNAHHKVTYNNYPVPILPANIAKKHTTEKVKVTVELLEAMQNNTGLSLSVIRNLLNVIPIDTDEIIEAHDEIGGIRMAKLGYDLKIIRPEVIESKNIKARELITIDYLALVGTESRLCVDISTILQGLYEQYKLRLTTTAKTKHASGADLEGLFGIRAKKVKIGKLNGYKILPA